MAQLSITDRRRIWRGLMRYWSNIWESCDASKAELLTTVQETDQWIDAAQGNYVSSLTHGAQFTAMQKTLIFCCVAIMRVSPGIAKLLQRFLGVEVD